MCRMDCLLPITHCTLDSTYCNVEWAHNARCDGWIAHCGSHYPLPTLGFHSASNCLPFVYFWPLHPFSWCTLLWSQRYIACSLSHSVHSDFPLHGLKIVMINIFQGSILTSYISGQHTHVIYFRATYLRHIFQGNILMSYISGQHTYVTNRKIYLIGAISCSIPHLTWRFSSPPSIHPYTM